MNCLTKRLSLGAVEVDVGASVGLGEAAEAVAGRRPIRFGLLSLAVRQETTAQSQAERQTE
jgi:hypothetical protein